MHIILQCLVLAQLIFITLSQSCLNSKGEQVDWWFILKMPKSRKNGWTGLDYFYCDKDNDCEKFNLQNDELDSDTSPLMQTIKDIDFTDTDVISMLWSDQPNDIITYSDHAHSKGIMNARLNGNKNAFIISHSTPRFPKLDEFGQIDKKVENNFARNGQHFLCLSSTTDKIDQILADRYYEAEIQIYKVSSTPGRFFSVNYPRLEKLWQTKKPGKGQSRIPYSQTNDHSHVRFTTRGNSIFKIFSKNQKFQQDFYAQFVAQELQQDLIMETWVRKINEKGLDEPVCEEFQTSSNEKVEFKGKRNDKDVTFEYSYTKDHSKYGITLPRKPETTSKAAASSFITTDYLHPSIKGQIFTSTKNLRKMKVEKEEEDIKEDEVEDEDEDEEGKKVPSESDESMEIDHHGSDEKFLGRKRKRDDSDKYEPPTKRQAMEIKKKEKYVCISDLNRQESQWFRGGVVYCFYNENLWGHIDTAFTGKQLCKS